MQGYLSLVPLIFDGKHNDILILRGNLSFQIVLCQKGTCWFNMWRYIEQRMNTPFLCKCHQKVSIRSPKLTLDILATKVKPFSEFVIHDSPSKWNMQWYNSHYVSHWGMWMASSVIYCRIKLFERVLCTHVSSQNLVWCPSLIEKDPQVNIILLLTNQMLHECL